MCFNTILGAYKNRWAICKMKIKSKSSGQDGDMGRYASLPLTTKRSTTTNLKTKEQPEWPENQTVRKPNNQVVKKETFIQTARRGGDCQLGWRG